jgi:hypothetical protein
MQDPVVLVETGHTYERQNIQNWYNKGQRVCPRSGKALSGWKLQLVRRTCLLCPLQMGTSILIATDGG